MAQSKAQTATAKLYRIRNWDSHFEGSKTKTYNNKSTCSMPCKHGLGYRKLIKSKDGPSLFGAWCALVQILSRHNKPRSGYCTDDGTSKGAPYTPDDLELITDIPTRYFTNMFKIVSSQSVGWVDVIHPKGSTGIPQATIVPLNSDSDLDLDSNLDSNLPSSDGDEFLKQFNAITGKSHRKLVDKALRQFKARIKDGYTIEDMVIATKNASLSNNHKESNMKHLTPELITREEKLDMWLNAKSKATQELF